MIADPGRVSLRLQVENEDSSLPLTFYASTAIDLRKVLQGVETIRLGQHPMASWMVNTGEIEITASANGISETDLQAIVMDTYEGFRAIVQDDEELPSTLTDDAQKLIRRIVRRIRNREAHQARIEVVGRDALEIKRDPDASHLPIPRGQRLQNTSWAFGAVDGELDIISVRGNPYFVIFEHVVGHRVRCLFSDEFVQNVKDCLGKRVYAEGMVRYRIDGVPTMLDRITSLALVPEPSIEDIVELRGTLSGLTGDLSSYEYVRELRDGVDA